MPNKYAIVYTWPGGNTNAESEVIRRMLVAAKNIGVKIDVVSKEGFILDSDFNTTATAFHDGDYEFMITLHYDDVKMWDSFHYHTLWNPPLISLQYAQYPNIVKNIISNDDFLIYDDGGMSDHLQAMLIDTPRNLQGASSLIAGFPATATMKTNLDNPTLFYCGINWEKMIGATPRHEGLFQLLDKLDNVKLFGPASTWKGYKTYCGTIPFDGFSLIQEINKCGVVLALSSDFHYRAGAATNRVYEGCAAGAVVISDTNRFIKKHFGDSVLYIDFDKEHPERMFEQIKKHLDWIKNNKDKALKLAQKSQQIFLEKFTFEKQLLDVIANHKNRVKAVSGALYAKNDQTKTLVTLFLDSVKFSVQDEMILKNAINNIQRQIDKNIVLAICCDNKNLKAIKKFTESLKSNIDIVFKPFDIYDEFDYKWMSRGQMLLDTINDVPHDYLCILSGAESMFSDHITTLKRRLEDNPDAVAAHCGTFLQNKDGNRYPVLNHMITKREIYDCALQNKQDILSGYVLFAKKAESYLSKYICEYLDGLTAVALLNIAVFKHHDKICYSCRTTCGCQEDYIHKYPQTIDFNKQINFIHGLVEYNMPEYESAFRSKSLCASDAINDSMIEWLSKINRFRLRLRIGLIKLRGVFVLNKKHREKNKRRIERYRAKMNKTCLV